MLASGLNIFLSRRVSVVSNLKRLIFIVLKSYLDGRGDAETKVTLDAEIWHRTGDAGRLDEEGKLWLLGRHQARWNDLYPLQIEAAGSSASSWNQMRLLARGSLPRKRYSCSSPVASRIGNENH